MYTYASGGGGGGGAAGDVEGPASSTDNAIARFDSTTGKVIQDSAVTVSDLAAASVTVASVAGNALVVDVPEPAAAAGASVAGKTLTLAASDAVASTDTDGAAAGGAVAIASGAAKRRTSGNANGGDITLTPGTGIGSGVSGNVVVADGQLNGPSASTFTIRSGSGRALSLGVATTELVVTDAAAAYTLFRGNKNVYFRSANDSDIFFKSDGVNNNLGLATASQVGWVAGASVFGASIDTGVARAAAAVVRVSNGSTGVGALNHSFVVEAHTTGDTLTEVESNSVHTNAGAGASVTLVLPAAAAGLSFTFCVQAAHDLVVDAAAGDVIQIAASASAAGGTATNAVVGSTLRLIALDDTNWFAVGAPNGTWALSV